MGGGWVESLPALADLGGFEPPTDELTARYSAIELQVKVDKVYLTLYLFVKHLMKILR